MHQRHVAHVHALELGGDWRVRGLSLSLTLSLTPTPTLTLTRCAALTANVAEDAMVGLLMQAHGYPHVG